MQHEVSVHKLSLTDLNMYQCGKQNCEPGHAYGPAVRDHYLIHFIFSGKGKFSAGGKTHYLGKGQGFLIVPDAVTFYQADYEDPWTYCWVGFHGLKAEEYLKAAGLSEDNPIFTYTSDDYIQQCFSSMFETSKLQKGREIRLLGHLYLFLSQLIETNGNSRFPYDSDKRTDAYIKKAIEFFTMNYSRKVTICDAARYVGLDRSYLGSVFSRQTGMTMQEYLVRLRMDKACDLMGNSGLAIGDIARSVGYDDQLLFSKVFKKYKGSSPRNYRKEYYKVSAN